MRTATAKISISLPQPILRAADRERQARGETRSEFFRRAVEDLVKRRQEAEDVRRYVEAYQRIPDDPAEDAMYDALAAETVSSEPWK